MILMIFGAGLFFLFNLKGKYNTWNLYNFQKPNISGMSTSDSCVADKRLTSEALRNLYHNLLFYNRKVITCIFVFPPPWHKVNMRLQNCFIIFIITTFYLDRKSGFEFLTMPYGQCGFLKC